MPVPAATALPRRRLARLIACLWLAVFAAAPAPAPAETTPADRTASARATVEGFHARLLAVMKDAKTMGLKGRFETLQPELQRRFNLRVMAAIASGSGWTGASAAERDRLVAAFGRFSAANYAANFDDWSGESFETVSVAAGPRGTTIVATRLKRPKDKPVKIAYVTRPSETGSQIVDVLVDDGISELAIRRSEYGAVLQRSGMAGLIEEIGSKTRVLLKE